jgi:phage shock protein E
MMKKILILMTVLIGFAVHADPVYWIDVRTGVEHSMGYLEGSVNIPHGDIGEKIAAITQDKNAEIHLYCRSGGRAGKALQTLESLGYTNVVNDGGYEELLEKSKILQQQ